MTMRDFINISKEARERFGVEICDEPEETSIPMQLDFSE